jgi:hypothetical protein
LLGYVLETSRDSGPGVVYPDVRPKRRETMKTILPLALALGLSQGVLAQPAESTPVAPPADEPAAAGTSARNALLNRATMERYGIPAKDWVPSRVPPNEAPRLDLDFPGGTPEELIMTLRVEAGQSVNAIIPDDVADTQIPAMSLRNVTLEQLFQAIEAASRKTALYPMSTARSSAPGRPPVVSYQSYETGYGFRTVGERGENAIWHFYREDAPVVPEPKPPRAVRFHQLAAYLDTFSVEDITTAIRTGWDLLEAENEPRLKFHEETKLLIAVGDPELLETIDNVLDRLHEGLATNDPFAQPAR